MTPDSNNPVSGIRFEETIPPPAVPDHELIRCIGRGSYGEVWLARNVMGTYRAVKVVHRRSFQDERPFEREFAGLQRFEPVSRSHDSQVDILHMGRGEDSFYYVMELADDELTGPEIDPDHYRPKTLRSTREGQLTYTADETLEIGLALTTALEHLHKHGLVHRDIKPSNVIFVNGIPKLADIGLVSSVDATRSFVGTEGFVPPEGPGAPTGDLYSLGKVLYELCTGRDRKDYPELPTTIVERPDHERLLELNAVIAKACRENPKDRYPSATAMKQDLLLMQSGKSVRRMQKLEQRLMQVRRLGIAALILITLASSAYLFQRQQTAEAKRLADENIKLADESKRFAEESQRNAEASQKNAKESNDNLVRLLVANGNKLVNDGKYADSLPWFADALKRVAGDKEREEMHRIRLDSVVRQIPRIVRLFRHDAGVFWCEFSPDGKRIATASKDHTARIWDVVSGRPVTPVLQHDAEVLSSVFSPDGNELATTSRDKSVRLWNAATGEALFAPLPHDSIPQSVTFSFDGRLLLTTQKDGPALVWNAHTGQEIQGGWNLANNTRSACLSTDGHLLATGDSSGMVTVWNLETRKQSFPKFRAGVSINVVCFSPDGRSILTCLGSGDNDFRVERGSAHVWNAVDGESLTPEMLHDTSVIKGEFSPDGTKILTAQADINEVGIARIWSAKTGLQLGTDLDQGSAIWTATFSPDGSRVVTCSENGTARVWNVVDSKPVTNPLPCGDWTLHASFSSDGELLATASQDGLVRIWNLMTDGGPEKIFRGDLDDETARDGETEMIDATVSPDGGTVAGAVLRNGGKGTAYLWDLATGTNLYSKLQHTNGHIGTVEFSADGSKLLVAPRLFRGDNATIWSVATGELLFELNHGAGLKHAVFSPDGAHILTVGMDGVARVWNSVTGKREGAEMHHDKLILDGEFSPDGSRVVTASFDKTAQIWDWMTGQRILPPFDHDSEVYSARFSPDGNRIVTTTLNQQVHIWDACTGERVGSPLPHGGTVWGTSAFHPNGHVFSSYSEAPYVYVWDLNNGSRILPPLNHVGRVFSVAFSPDGKVIATASADNTARLWDYTTGEPISVPLRHGGSLNRVRFHPAQPLVLTASKDGAARTWRYQPLTWPLEDIVHLTELLSASEISGTLDRSGITADRISRAFESLRSKHADFFSVSPDRAIAWHRSEADSAELSLNWPVVIWHLSALIEANPNDGTAYFRRGDAAAELGRWKDACRDFERAAQLGEHSRSSLIVASMKAGDRATARRAIAEFIRKAANSESRREWIPFYTVIAPALLEDTSTLTSITEELQMEDPSSISRAVRLALLYSWTGREHEAVQLLDSDLLSSLKDPGRLGEFSFYHYFYAVQLMARAGRIDSAKKVFSAINEEWAWTKNANDYENSGRRILWQQAAHIDLLRDEAEASIVACSANFQVPTDK